MSLVFDAAKGHVGVQEQMKIMLESVAHVTTDGYVDACGPCCYLKPY